MNHQAMFRDFRSTILRSLLLGLALLISAAANGADDKTPVTKEPEKPPASLAADKIEAALKQYGLFYQRIESPGQQIAFTIGVQDDKSRSSIQHYTVGDCGWKYTDGTEAISIHAYSQVVAQANMPAAVGEKIAEFNDIQVLTWGSMNSSGAYALTGFFFDHGLDPGTIHAYVMNLHWTTTALQDAVGPVLKGLSQEK